MSLQSIVITGASRGLGLEYVRQLLASDKPPKHLIATIRQSGNEELDKLGAKHKSLHVLQLDTKNYNEFAKFADKVQQIVGSDGVDTVINNAGTLTRIDLESVTAEDMLNVYAINTVAPVMLTKALLPLLRTSGKQRKTAVINISSDLGSIENNKKGSSMFPKDIFPSGYFSAFSYRASKSALNQVSKTMSNELDVDGIIVISLHPGWVQTDMGGPNAHLTPQTSIANMIRTITKVKKEDSGKFFNYDGKILPY